jgi:WD40 repeat protein
VAGCWYPRCGPADQDAEGQTRHHGPDHSAHRLIGHTNAVWGAAFAPVGRILATTSADQTVRLWNPPRPDAFRSDEVREACLRSRRTTRQTDLGPIRPLVSATRTPARAVDPSVRCPPGPGTGSPSCRGSVYGGGLGRLRYSRRLYFRLIHVRSQASADYRELGPSQVMDGADRTRTHHRD